MESTKNKSLNIKSVDADGSKIKSAYAPIDVDNMQDSYWKHHKASIETLKKTLINTAERMQRSSFTVVERNQEVLSLKNQLQDLNGQLQDLNNKSSELSRENEDLKEKIIECNKKYISLELAYDKEIARIANENGGMIKQAKGLQEKLKILERENRESIGQFERKIQQKDTELAKLNLENAQLKTRIADIEAANQQNRQEFETIKDLIRKYKESNEVHKSEVELAVSNLKNAEDRVRHLEEVNEQLSSKLSDTDESLAAAFALHQVELGELRSANSKLNSDVKSYENEIQNLKKVHEQNKDLWTKEADNTQAELSALRNENIQLKTSIEVLKQAHLNTTDNLSAETAELTQQLQAQKLLNEEKIYSLQEDVKEKDAIITENQIKIAELEMDKHTIAELMYKMKQIKNVSTLPINTAGLICNNQSIATKLNEAPTLAGSPKSRASPAATSSRSRDVEHAMITEMVVPTIRRERKRYHQYFSDFNTETDESDIEPGKPKLRKKNQVAAKGKRVSRVLPTAPQFNDAFDKLKSTNKD